VAEGRVLRGRRLQPLQHVRIGRGFHQKLGGADARQILLGPSDAAVGGDLVIDLGGSRRIARGDLAGQPEPRQDPVAGRRLGGEISKGGLGLGMLVLLGQFRGPVEGGAGLGGLPGFQVLIATPATDAGNDQDRQRDDVERVLVPQLLELLPTDFLVEFVK